VGEGNVPERDVCLLVSASTWFEISEGPPGARRRVDLAVTLIAIAFAGVLPGEGGKVWSPDRHSSSISDCPQPWKCPPHL
jgi:hypothetical protein